MKKLVSVNPKAGLLEAEAVTFQQIIGFTSFAVFSLTCPAQSWPQVLPSVATVKISSKTDLSERKDGFFSARQTHAGQPSRHAEQPDHSQADMQDNLGNPLTTRWQVRPLPGSRV